MLHIRSEIEDFDLEKKIVAFKHKYLAAIFPLNSIQYREPYGTHFPLTLSFSELRFLNRCSYSLGNEVNFICNNSQIPSVQKVKRSQTKSISSLSSK